MYIYYTNFLRKNLYKCLKNKIPVRTISVNYGNFIKNLNYNLIISPKVSPEIPAAFASSVSK